MECVGFRTSPLTLRVWPSLSVWFLEKIFSYAIGDQILKYLDEELTLKEITTLPLAKK